MRYQSRCNYPRRRHRNQNKEKNVQLTHTNMMYNFKQHKVNMY